MYLRNPNVIGFALNSRQIVASLKTSKNFKQTSLSRLKRLEKQWKWAKPFRKIPGPSRLSMLTSFRSGGAFAGLSYSDYLLKCREMYGNTIRVPGMFRKEPMVIIFNAADIKTVLDSEGTCPEIEALQHYKKKYQKKHFLNISDLIPNKEANWDCYRGAINTILMETGSARLFLNPITKSSTEFVQRIKDLRDPSTMEVCGNFFDEIVRWALGSILLITTNKEMDFTRNNQDEPEVKLIIKSLADLFHLIHVLDFQPSIYRYVMTPAYKRFKDACDILFEKTSKYVNESIDRFEIESKFGRGKIDLTILGKLLKSNRKIATAVALDLQIAGVHTIASALVGILLMIAMHPRKQCKLRSEILSISPNNDIPFTVENIKKLVYLKASIKEGLRMFPITPGIMQNAGQNIVLDGYQIPKGARIFLASSFMQKDDSYFPRANEFIPERWLDNISPEFKSFIPKKVSSYSYLPYEFGSKKCVVKRIVKMELEVIMANLVRNFYIKYNYSTENAFQNRVINTPTIPLKFKFTDIQK